MVLKRGFALITAVLLTFSSVAYAEGEDLSKQDAFLKRLNDELNLSKTDYRQLLGTITDTKETLKSVFGEKISLHRQIEEVDKSITTNTAKLVRVIEELVEKENLVRVISSDIAVKGVALEYQKDLLKDYATLIYEQQNELLAVDRNGQVNAFKMLLADGSMGSNLRDIEYFNLLSEAGQQIADKLEGLSVELDEKKNLLKIEEKQLVALKDKLSTEKVQLAQQKEAKEKLLELTKGHEEIFAQLLEQSVAQQEAVAMDLKNLSNAVDFVREKIKTDGANFNPDDYMSLLDYKTKAIYKFQLDSSFGGNNNFIWPVEPGRGISAYFRDPSYVGTFGVAHNAVDIPTAQGTPVRAAADGIVYTAKDNGYGYSYVILAHKNGLMTVHGHMSSILVEEGQEIPQGATIGLSGGMPGTKGAGYMTTGPHLHFEVHLNGGYTDPLNYLPLAALSEDNVKSLPEKYRPLWEAASFAAEGVKRAELVERGQ